MHEQISYQHPTAVQADQSNTYEQLNRDSPSSPYQEIGKNRIIYCVLSTHLINTIPRKKKIRKKNKIKRTKKSSAVLFQ